MDNALTQEIGRLFEKSANLEQQIKNAQKSLDTEEDEYTMYLEKQKTDSLNAIRLGEIVKENGWISKTEYGERASNQAIKMIRNATLAQQTEFLPILKEAKNNKEVNLAEMAFVEDMILKGNNKKQLYGTQLSFNKDKGRNDVYPIENPSEVNARRLSVGLDSLHVYCKKFGIKYTY